MNAPHIYCFFISKCSSPYITSLVLSGFSIFRAPGSEILVGGFEEDFCLFQVAFPVPIKKDNATAPQFCLFPS